MKDLWKATQTSNALNISDRLPAIECMPQGVVLEFPCDMTVECVCFGRKLGKMIKCDHIGYPIIGGREAKQYKNSEIENFQIVKIEFPWVFAVPKGY